MRLVLVLGVLLIATPVLAGPLFMTGMEMGDPRPNSGDTDLVAVAGGALEQSIVRTGAWALQMDGGSTGVLIRNTLATTTLACRFYVYAQAFPSDNFLYRLATSIGGTLFEITLTGGGQVQLSSAGAGFSTTTGTAVLSPNTWFRIDAVYDTASGGVGQVYVNGALDINTTHTGAQANVVNVSVSGSSASGGTLHHYLDDMFCQDGTSQPPDGRIVVRQGTSGTPTNNAWTKNNCTNIEDCWSNTGFTTLTNADSGLIAPAIAQTMVVAPFSTPQTGHGSEVIATGSTINGIQLAAAADASNTSNGAFRRYVNGVGPTDNAITVINTPIHGYKTPFFTDSVANLDLYQIGWNKTNTGAARKHTVYDMWMMVDYLPPPSTLRIKVTQ